MITFTQYLIEKRSNPDKNEREDPFQQLRKYGDDAKHIYISYTEIDKIGINPSTTYNTPNGIYTYQLDWVLKNSRNIRDVPYVGDKQHIWAITPTEKVFRLNDYTDDNLDRDIEKLRVKFNNPKNDAEFDYILQEAVRDNKHKTNESAGIMWNFTRHLAKENVNRWSAILRDVLGYSIIRDDGLSIIHHHEPHQTVFLSKSVFKVVEKLNNSSSKSLFNRQSTNIKEKLKSEKGQLREVVKIYLRSGKLPDLVTVFTHLEKFQESFARKRFKGEMLVGPKEWKQLKDAIMNTKNIKYISFFTHVTKQKDFKEFILSSPNNALIYLNTIMEYSSDFHDRAKDTIGTDLLIAQIVKSPKAIINLLNKYSNIPTTHLDLDIRDMIHTAIKRLHKFPEELKAYMKTLPARHQYLRDMEIVADLKVGDNVKIIGGPFFDFDGVVKKINDESASVAVSIFGKTIMHDIDMDDLKVNLN